MNGSFFLSDKNLGEEDYKRIFEQQEDLDDDDIINGHIEDINLHDEDYDIMENIETIPICPSEDLAISQELESIEYEDIERYNMTMNDKPEGLKEFHELKPSTMTIVIFFKVPVVMNVVWHLLDIDYDPTFKRNGKKLAWPGRGGLVLNCRYKLRQRGPCWKSSFKNSVNIDVTTSMKNISLKISELSFQMCGASSEDDAREASLTVLDKIHKVYNHQVYSRMNFGNYCDVYNYFLVNARGEKVIKHFDRRHFQYSFCNDRKKKRKCSFIVNEKTAGHLLVHIPNVCPKELDPYIWEFLYSYYQDVLYNEGLYEEFMEKLELIHKLPYIYRDAVDGSYIEGNELCTFNQIMVNYNYSFPKCVDREVFNHIAGKLEPMNVFSRFYKDFNNNVSIEYVSNNSNIDPRIKKNKNKPYHQTLIIYKTSSITMSCRSEAEAVKMYNICRFIYCRYQDLVVDRDLTELRDARLEKKRRKEMEGSQ